MTEIHTEIAEANSDKFPDLIALGLLSGNVTTCNAVPASCGRLPIQNFSVSTPEGYVETTNVAIPKCQITGQTCAKAAAIAQVKANRAGRDGKIRTRGEVITNRG